MTFALTCDAYLWASHHQVLSEISVDVKKAAVFANFFLTEWRESSSVPQDAAGRVCYATIHFRGTARGSNPPGSVSKRWSSVQHVSVLGDFIRLQPTKKLQQNRHYK